jgi:putative sterol carrier protein
MSDEIPMFLSQKWLDRFAELVNASEEYEKSAHDWEGSFIFQVYADNDKVKEPLRGFVDLWHGKCRGVHVAGDGDTADFTYSSSLENWRKLFKKETGPIKGIMARKFKLDGSLRTIMRYVRAAQILLDIAISVPMRLPDE